MEHSFVYSILLLACIVVGLVLEIVRHTTSEDIIRGFIFFFVAAIVLIPGGEFSSTSLYVAQCIDTATSSPAVYAVLHVYLAAKRVGRVRFSSVWFFR